MSDKDIKGHNDIKSYFLIKNNIQIFSLSQLSSKAKILVSKNNSFNYKFSSKGNFKPLKKNSDKYNNREISLIEVRKNNNFLRDMNIDVPSSEKLLQKNFQKEFMEDYENSFAYFCGINKIYFNEIYIKNRYTPILSKFGDINISIKSIIDILNNFSFSLEMKVRRRFKRNKINKVFKIFKNKLNRNKNNFEIKNKIKKIRISKIEKIKNDNLNIIHPNSKNEFGILKNDKIDNLKKRLTISIEKNNNNKIQELQNSNNAIFKRNPTIVYKDLINKDMESNSNKISFNKQNNLINFNSKDAQNSENINIIDPLNKKIFPFKFNINENFYNNSYNEYNSFVLSPHNILSPSIQHSYSNISSPFNLPICSPFFVPNMDRFTFNSKNIDNSFAFENHNSNYAIIEGNNIANNNNINNKIISRNTNTKIEKVASINSNDFNKNMNFINKSSANNLLKKNI